VAEILVSESIFIVEDDPIIAEIIAWRIREMGYIVIPPVQTGEEAIEFCKQKRPDLVLMDISLKGKINGIDAAMKIKKELKIPLIFLTAHTEGKFLEQAKKVCPDGYIHKPFDDDDLRVAIQLVL
jgi:CheY-like chemotaxis protein